MPHCSMLRFTLFVDIEATSQRHATISMLSNRADRPGKTAVAITDTRAPPRNNGILEPGCQSQSVAPRIHSTDCGALTQRTKQLGGLIARMAALGAQRAVSPRPPEQAESGPSSSSHDRVLTRLAQEFPDGRTLSDRRYQTRLIP